MAYHTLSRDEREMADEPSTVPCYSIAQLFDFLLTMVEREATLRPPRPNHDLCLNCLRRDIRDPQPSEASNDPGDRRYWSNVSPGSSFMDAHLPPILPDPNLVPPLLSLRERARKQNAESVEGSAASNSGTYFTSCTSSPVDAPTPDSVVSYDAIACPDITVSSAHSAPSSDPYRSLLATSALLASAQTPLAPPGLHSRATRSHSTIQESPPRDTAAPPPTRTAPPAGITASRPTHKVLLGAGTSTASAPQQAPADAKGKHCASPATTFNSTRLHAPSPPAPPEANSASTRPEPGAATSVRLAHASHYHTFLHASDVTPMPMPATPPPATVTSAPAAATAAATAAIAYTQAVTSGLTDVTIPAAAGVVSQDMTVNAGGEARPVQPFFAPESNDPDWYAVIKGRKVGVFDNNFQAVASTNGIRGFLMKQYNTQEEAMGKEARRRENKIQAEKCRISKLTWVGVQVPAELTSRSLWIFRVSFAVHDTGPLLGLWTRPYNFEMPDLCLLPSSEGDDNTESPWSSRAAVLGAYQYGEVIEAGHGRFEQWMDNSLVLDEIEADVKREVIERVEAWERLAKAMTTDAQGGEVVEVGLNWGAKVIRMLVEEWEVRKDNGADGYREHRKTSSLPWQKLMKDTMRLFNTENS
ncbi:hypothetical protein TRAPUB_3499 [Trametes pubescens]|uniref:Ribonuclease H1 N-terminal domain-containing protein n=1 Tax=Trametes pubescens TaxID=154538 RepID=A0A1M2VDE4_TRAPU|nr:hypothetical protein TRAPUB_3499 [Trametes pubescens]